MATSTTDRNGHEVPATPTITPERGDVPTGGVVPSPPKLRRRPLMLLAGVVLVATGALVAVWAWLATTDTSEVVAVRETVMRGEVIDAGDLITVQVGTDPALRTVPGTDLQTLVGQRAARDMAAGSLLTLEAVTDQVVPTAGRSVVGLALTPALMPGEPLQVGDQVRVVGTAGGQGDPAAAGETVTFPAEVVGVAPATQTGQTVVSVHVEAEQAPVLASWAASGRVALVLDNREG